ncbi:hypothetical protein QR680_013163 [Steinernema hermaphroditum]|uniref:Uncharacterized protein n=1 Tax=Steinernema hermaphroditum TaxID=289476 RepID=A0AA39M1T2_9BILA|nr:hypothetical protein QR680_013163 [Steinernema hermaphroditum]
MAAPPIPIKVVEVPMTPPSASPPPFYVQPKPKTSPCRWTTLALLVLLIWLSASALIILHLGPECLFKKFTRSDDDAAKTDALKTRLDDSADISVVDSLDKLLNSAKLRQVFVLTTDDESETATKTNVVDNDVETEEKPEPKTQGPLRVVDSSTDDLGAVPYRQGNLGSMQGFFVPAEHIFERERPSYLFGMNRPQWMWPSGYEQMELPRFMQAPPAYYPSYGLQSPNRYYYPFFRAQMEQFRPKFFYPQQQNLPQQSFPQNFQQNWPQQNLPQQGFPQYFQQNWLQQGFPQNFQQNWPQQNFPEQNLQQNRQQSFVQPQPAQPNPRPILAVDPNPLQWPQQQSPSSTEASVKQDSNEIFRKVEEEASKSATESQQPQLLSPSLGADIRDEIYRQLQRQSQLLSGGQERAMPTWAQPQMTMTSTEKPSGEVDIDEIYRQLQEESQKMQQEKEVTEKAEEEDEGASEGTDVIEDSFPRIEKMNPAPETSAESTTEVPSTDSTTEDSSFFKFFEEQAAKMHELMDKQPEEPAAHVDGDTKEEPKKETTTEAPLEEPKPALIFQDSSEPQEDHEKKETKETEVAWTKDQEPIQGDTEDKSMVRAERTN